MGEGLDAAGSRTMWEVMPDISKSQAKACPICGKPADQQFRPFCSKRCADIDLNRWFSGVYAVPVVEEQPRETAPPKTDQD
jgi:endogenous inhibitor of DNA gyrase (YacG/DUF329 family)